jgi:hypothetical protein
MGKIWRLKNQEEFTSTGRWDVAKGMPVGWNSEKKMNYLLGKRLPNSQYSACRNSEVVVVDNWKIGPLDYIQDEEPFAVTGTPEAPHFDFDRLSKEINTMFQSKLDKAKADHTTLTTGYNTQLKAILESYKGQVASIFPEIKNALIAEIQRGHTTIVMPDQREVSIQEMDHPKMADVVQSLQLNHKAMLVGPAGTGKTYMVAEIADRLNLPFYKYSCSRDSSVHDLLGYKQPQSETYLETVFLKAYEGGGIFLVDEYDAMSGDMALFFNGVADNSKFISIPHRDDKPIAKKHKDFYLIMCGNTWGKGSVEYSGRDFQDMALMDRFRFCRHFIGYHTIFEKHVMANNYEFAMSLRGRLEKFGSYLSTRNVEDISNLIRCRQTRDQIVEMIAQDLLKSDQQSLMGEMRDYTIKYETVGSTTNFDTHGRTTSGQKRATL